MDTRNCFATLMTSLLLLLLLQQPDIILGQEERVAEQCYWSSSTTISLSCPLGTRINVLAIELGETSCLRRNCCPSSNDCVRAPSSSHANAVHSACNGQQDCRLGVAQEKTSCQWTGTNEYERIRYQCLDVDECTAAHSGPSCSPLATCSNTQGSYSCQCVDGYQGNGFTCTDVDECVASGGQSWCSLNATCTNTPGSYSCQCNDGFHGDGFTCTDIDECVTSVGMESCSQNATCINLHGNFTCQCNAGYIGDGYTCTDVDECTRSGDDAPSCSPHATCTNEEGSYSCQCNEGFSGDGFTCNANIVLIPSVSDVTDSNTVPTDVQLSLVDDSSSTTTTTATATTTTAAATAATMATVTIPEAVTVTSNITSSSADVRPGTADGVIMEQSRADADADADAVADKNLFDSLTSTQIASIAAGLVGLVLLVVVLAIVIVSRRRRLRRHKLDISNPMSPEPLIECISSSSALVARQLSAADSNCDDSPTANGSGSGSNNSNNNNDVTLDEIDLITIDQQPLYSHPVWRGDASSQCPGVGATLTVMNASYDSVDEGHLKPVL